MRFKNELLLKWLTDNKLWGKSQNYEKNNHIYDRDNYDFILIISNVLSEWEYNIFFISILSFNVRNGLP